MKHPRIAYPADGGDQRRFSIKEWPEADRPREKLVGRGAEALTEAELLAVLIHTGSAGKSALDLARDLLRAHADLRLLSRRPLQELARCKGIGTTRAARIMAAFEIGRRTAAIRDADDDHIGGPEDVAQRFIPLMRDLPTERFVALLLNNANQVIREHVISEGSVNASIVHPREVFKAAVTELATSVILLHNHPSGTKLASKEDHAVTKQLVDAGKLIDIPVRDHIIICGNSYISFAENGWL
jgi:DNA repair protein RadC